MSMSMGSLGADPEDQVPFEKYAKAAESLLKPSSAARAVASGAPFIERVDLLVKLIAHQSAQMGGRIAPIHGRRHGTVTIAPITIMEEAEGIICLPSIAPARGRHLGVAEHARPFVAR
jgi:hypothetical protein